MSETSWALEAETAPLQLGGVTPLRSLETPAANVRLERVAVPQLVQHQSAWADLTRRALEPNVFLEPGFALPLMQHIAPRRRPDVLLAWEDASSGARMIGLLPVSCPRLARGRARGFHDELATLGIPLLDRDRGATAFAAMLDWLASRSPRPSALVLTDVPADGPFMRGVVPSFEGCGRMAILASHERAVLRRSDESGGNVLSMTSAKTRKERKRQRRRLADHGTRAYVSARTPDAIARATESFLTLEHKGWKGDRGTALLADLAHATFTRSMTEQMALADKCRIDALEINGQAVAMGIVLTSGQRAYFWKTAFDEDLAPLSPGVQFALDLAEVQLGEDAITLTDSCAMPNHPMIDKLWPDRMSIVDVAIAVGPPGSVAFSLSVASERALRRARAWAKSGTAWLRRRAHRGAR